MTTQSIFVNLPVADLERSKGFFTALGFAIEPKFTDERGACVVVDPDHIYLMLLTREFFGTFTQREVGEPAARTTAIFALTCPSREAVDAMVAKAIEAGGAPTGMPAQDHGWMYYASFYDPDGHHFEVLHGDEDAVEG
ncbi:MAG: VOC family protein [Myxococcales bacterium]|nr:VOC family protein [Myxococcales bacterium]